MRSIRRLAITQTYDERDAPSNRRAAALLAAWDAVMAEVYEYVAMDRERRPEQIVFRFVRDETMEGEMVKA